MWKYEENITLFPSSFSKCWNSFIWYWNNNIIHVNAPLLPCMFNEWIEPKFIILSSRIDSSKKIKTLLFQQPLQWFNFFRQGKQSLFSRVMTTLLWIRVWSIEIDSNSLVVIIVAENKPKRNISISLILLGVMFDWNANSI